MSICWYCAVNAWPAEIVDVYDATIAKYAPRESAESVRQILISDDSHAVWDDENFDDECIDYAINTMLAYDQRLQMETLIRLDSLFALKQIPESVRVPYSEVEIDAYYDAHGSVPPAKGRMKPIP